MSEERLSSEVIYDGRVVKLRKDSVKLPNGKTSYREVVEHKAAVVILAENDAGEVMLIDQYRYPVQEEIIELPAGLVEPGEDLAEAAIRELREETGLKPGKLEHIAEVWSSPGFTDELFEIYHAAELEHSPLQADDDEFITARFRSETEIRELVASGKIKDAKTLLGIYWWLHRKDSR